MAKSINSRGLRVILVPCLFGPLAMLLGRALVVEEAKGRRQTARRVRKALRAIRKFPNK